MFGIPLNSSFCVVVGKSPPEIVHTHVEVTVVAEVTLDTTKDLRSGRIPEKTRSTSPLGDTQESSVDVVVRLVVADRAATTEILYAD